MTQKFSWTLLIAGGLAFLGMLGHDLKEHSTWAAIFTPESVGDSLVQLATVGVSIAGALGVKLDTDNK